MTRTEAKEYIRGFMDSWIREHARLHMLGRKFYQNQAIATMKKTFATENRFILLTALQAQLTK